MGLLSSYAPPALPDVPAPTTVYGFNLDRQATTTQRPDGLALGRLCQPLAALATPDGNVTCDYFGLMPYPGCAPGRVHTVTDPISNTCSGAVADVLADCKVGAWDWE